MGWLCGFGISLSCYTRRSKVHAPVGHTFNIITRVVSKDNIAQRFMLIQDLTKFMK